MKFSGIQKLSLLDYPGKMCATVFTDGCNFRCPFCHNSSLVIPGGVDNASKIDEEEILTFLRKRVGIIDGVCITGGEPTLYGDELIAFMQKVKDLGLLVKLDTNGTRPDIVRKVVENRIADYIAMDIKSSIEGYSLLVGKADVDTDAIKESIALLQSGDTDFEFRTTAVKPIHTAEDFESIGKLLQGDEKYFLQCYKNSGDILIESDEKTLDYTRAESEKRGVAYEGLTAFSEEEMRAFLDTVKNYIPRAELRGI